MTKKQLINQIDSKMMELEDQMSDCALDFCHDYKGEEIRYLSDYFHEYADGSVSIYYSDQRQYYYDNTEDCNDALLEYGYDLTEMLKDCGDLDTIICRAGAIGQYEYFYRQLSQNESEITIYLRLYNLLQIIGEIKTKEAQQFYENIISDNPTYNYEYIPLKKEDFE